MYYIKCNYSWNNRAQVGKIYEVKDLDTKPDFSSHKWRYLVNSYIKNAFVLIEKPGLIEEEIY